MRIGHKVNHGWAANRNDPERARRVEREASATTDAAERAFQKAELRLIRAQERMARAAAEQEMSPKRLAVLEAIVEARRDELKELERMLTASPAGSQHRGRGSHRGVPNGGVW